MNQKKGGVFLSYSQMVLNVLVKFIYTPFLLRALGQSEYGLFSLVMSIVGYLSILDFGFGGTVTRYTVKYKAENDKDSLYKLYGTLSVVYIVIGLIALITCFILSISTASLFGDTMTNEEVGKLRIMILLVGVNLLFSFPLQISTSVVVAYEKFILKNGIALLRTILQPTVMILLLYLLNMKAVGAIVIVTLFNFVTYLIYYIYSVRRLDFKFSIKRFDSGLIKDVIAFSVWMFLMMIFEQLQFNSGQFIIGLFNGTDIIAIWGIAMIFILNYRSLATAISNVFAPSLMQRYFQNNDESACQTIYSMTRLQSIVLFFILFNFILFGEQFITMWAGPQYGDAFYCSVIVMTPMTFSLILDFCSWVQVAKNDFVFRTITLYLCLIASFVIIYLLKGVDIRSYALYMAMSIVTGQIICVLIYIRKKLTVSIVEIFKNIMQVTLPMLIVFGFCFVVRNEIGFHIINKEGILQLVLDILVFNVVFSVVTWFLSLNKIERELAINRKK